MKLRLHSVIGEFPPTFWTLWIGTLINRMGSIVAPFLALYLTGYLNFTPSQAGTVGAAYGLGMMIAGPLGGALADRIGRRPALICGLLAGGSAMLVLGACREPWEVTAMAFVLGLVGDLYRPAFFAIVADVVPTADRPRAYGLLYWVLNVGFAVALPFAGIISEYDPRLLFFIDAGSTFAFAIVAWKWLPETLQARTASEPAHPPWKMLLVPLRDPKFLALQLPFFATAVVLMQSQLALSIDLTSRGLSPAGFGMLLSFNGIMIVAAQPAILPLVTRWSRPIALAVGALLIGLGFGLHMFSSTVVLAMIAVAVWTLGDMAQQSVLPAAIADIAPKSLRATYEGASFMVWGLASSAAPAVGGQFLSRFGGDALWAACAVVGLIASISYLSIHRAMRRRSE